MLGILIYFFSAYSSVFPVFVHWEIKGRFRKRVVLANVPSFRFSFRGNIRRNHPFGNHPFVNHQKGSLGDKRAVSKRVVLANVPSFRFSFRGNIRRNHPFGNHLFANPRFVFRKAQHSSSQTGNQKGEDISKRSNRHLTEALGELCLQSSYTIAMPFPLVAQYRAIL